MPMADENDAEIAWAAGLFEGEGCFSPTTVKGRRYPRAQMATTDLDVMMRFIAVVGVGYFRVDQKKPPRKTQYRWVVAKRGDLAVFYALVGPWLGARRRARFEQMMEGG